VEGVVTHCVLEQGYSFVQIDEVLDTGAVSKSDVFEPEVFTSEVSKLGVSKSDLFK
jgi:hypothetical protein